MAGRDNGDGIRQGSLLVSAYRWMIASATGFRDVPIVCLSAFAACFTGERGAAASPLIAVYWTIQDADNDRKLA